MKVCNPALLHFLIPSYRNLISFNTSIYSHQVLQTPPFIAVSLPPNNIEKEKKGASVGIRGCHTARFLSCNSAVRKECVQQSSSFLAPICSNPPLLIVSVDRRAVEICAIFLSGTRRWNSL